MTHINDNTKPLIFLGSSYTMQKVQEICIALDISIQGIIDNDYYGNTKELFGIPVIDTEESFNDEQKLKYYKENFNFICVVTWTPEDNSVMVRNKNKRLRLLDLIDNKELPCITIIDPMSKVSKFAKIGKGSIIESFIHIEPNATIGDYVYLHWSCGIGHDTVIGRNSVIQSQVLTGAYCNFGENCYVGLGAKILKSKATIGSNSWIQESIYLKRSTLENEIVGIGIGNQKRVYKDDSLVF